MDDVRKRLMIFCAKQALGIALTPDYIDWATNELVNGTDSPSLRIIAGLSPNENLFVVEEYLKKAMKELGIEELKKDELLYSYADYLAEMLIKKEGDAANNVSMLYQISIKLGHPRIMGRWIALDEDLTSLKFGGPGYLMGVTKENVNEIVLREASEYLFERKHGEKVLPPMPAPKKGLPQKFKSIIDKIKGFLLR